MATYHTATTQAGSGMIWPFSLCLPPIPIGPALVCWHKSVPIGLHCGCFGTIYRIVYSFIGIIDVIIGVARTSTLEQVAGLEAQVRQLEEYGCERVYQEQVSSVGERVKLEEALSSLRTGDKLVVTKLDRLARSVQHLGQTIERINSAGASLVILDMGGTAVDTSNATGKLILNVMSSVSQFEREMMLERQREGIAKAKAEGKYKGRKPTARAKTDMVKLALANGVSKPQICKDLGISRTSLYRIVGDLAKEPAK